MGASLLRAVVVRRPTEYELLLAHHGTAGQAEFFLKSRGQTLRELYGVHTTIMSALEGVLAALPSRWRRTTISRDELARFLFEPDDVVIAVGQDGLVANVAKYLDGQLVVGINPNPQTIEGVLVAHPVAAARDLLADIDAGRNLRVQSRTMVHAAMDDGQELIALNEVFVGHRSHQSARYHIHFGGITEQHSSSGLICCTGTGATGWGLSLHRAMHIAAAMPGPSDPSLRFFVREAWSSKSSQAEVVSGEPTAQQPLRVTSQMNLGGVIFGDGIEEDYLSFEWGREVTIAPAQRHLRLVA